MTKRGKPHQQSVKPGQSLLLQGGLVRITPVGNDVLMAAAFLPLQEVHVTNTDKAIEMQAEKRRYPGQNIAKEGFGQTIASAGLFAFKYDVTKSHLPTRQAKAIEDGQASRSKLLSKLPYRVMAVDLLLEGSGWVELTMQIRAKSSSVPQVEVFSPHGRHIGSRPPIESYRAIAQKRAADRRKHGSRGRQNIGHLKRTRHSSKV